MTTYYVRSDAGGSGDGTANNSTDAWTLEQALGATPAFPVSAGDTLAIVADADYTGIDFTLAAGANGSNIFGTNASGVIDGTRPLLQWAASGGTYTSSRAMSMTNSSVTGFLDFDLNNNTSISNGVRHANAVMIQCRMTNCDSLGVEGTSGSRCIYCEVDGAEVGFGRCSLFYMCLSHNCSFADFRIDIGDAISCVGASDTRNFWNQDLGTQGIILNCIARRGTVGGTAMDINNPWVIINSVIENFTTAYDLAGTSDAVLLNNYSYNSTTDISGTPSNVGDSTITDADPGFVDPAGTPKDFGTSALLNQGIAKPPFEINGNQLQYAGLTQVISSGGGSGPLPGIGSAFIRSR